MLKICTKCKLSKSLLEFSKHKTGKLGLRPDCKSCQSQKNREYREKNYKILKEKKKNYTSTHREQKREYDKIYNKLNFKKKAKQRQEWRKNNKTKRNSQEREKRKNNIEYKIKQNLRIRVRKVLKRNQKSGSAIRDLGCSAEFFKEYLKSKFKPGMNWKNYGKKGWHIDHVKPLVLFDLTDRQQFLEACHYTNLQPLWESENCSKGKKYE